MKIEKQTLWLSWGYGVHRSKHFLYFYFLADGNFSSLRKLMPKLTHKLAYPTRMPLITLYWDASRTMAKGNGAARSLKLALAGVSYMIIVTINEG